MKKQMLAVLLTICMIFTMLPMGALAEEAPLQGTMGDSASPSSFTITFELNGGSGTATPQTVASGSFASEPAGITKDDFTLDGWYREDTFATRWDFAADTVTENTTLYANWAPENLALSGLLAAGGVTTVTTKEALDTALGEGETDVALGADISSTFQLNVGRDVILDLNGHSLDITLTAAEGYNANGIKIADGVTLTIRDSSTSSTGTLTVINGASSSTTQGSGAAINTSGSTFMVKSGTVIANGGYQGAGIGGGLSGDGGTVIISGGTVTATGGSNASGIGGGSGGSGGSVTIDSGTVTAIGGSTGAGIGGGNQGVGSLQVTVNGGEIMATGGYNGDGIGGAGEYQSYGVNITINGGKVTATGGQNAAGIGGSKTSSANCRITVNGGEVIATGGDNAAGIGGVPDGQGSIVAINGGEVTANGGAGAAGIGGGYPYRSCGTVTITGGLVTATGKIKSGERLNNSAAGIGSGGYYSGSDQPISVAISGGTIIATGSTGAAGIGGGAISTNGNWSYLQPGSLTITGGSVWTNNSGQSNAPVPKNEANQTLYLATLSVAGGSLVLYQFPNTSHVVKPADGYYAYGTKDLKTDFGGKVYFWLPEATYAIAIKHNPLSYANSAVKVTAGSGVTADLTGMDAMPLDILLSGTSVARNATSGTAIGTLSTIDLGGNPSFTYTLIPGEGSDHNHLFSIDNDVLKLSSTLDSVTVSSLCIRVKTTYVLGASYEKILSLQILELPGAPSISKLTVKNGAVVIEITPPASDGGSPITEYTATAYPGGATKTSTTPTVQFDGLTCGVPYTFTVTATNIVGTGPASAESGSIVPKWNQTITFAPSGNIPDIYDPSGGIYYEFGTSPTLSASSDSGLPVTLTSGDESIAKITSDGRLTFFKAGTVDIEAYQEGNDEYYEVRATQKIEALPVPPGAPIIQEVTVDGLTAIVSFTPPAFTGGSYITGYTVKSSPENLTASGSTSPITVSGLKLGTTYTFTVTAHANWLTGPASEPSGGVTPVKGPEVTSIDVPPSKTYTEGQNLDFTVNFDQTVIVTGFPRLALNIGSETCFAQYLDSSDPNSLSFRYTVTAGHSDPDGITVDALSLNGGTIKNEYGSAAVLTLNNVATTVDVLVDAAVPTVLGVSVPSSGIYAPGQNLIFMVYFSETVTVTGTPQIAIAVGSSTVYAQYLGGSGRSDLTFQYTVASGQDDSDGIVVHTLDLNGGTIQDNVKNNASLILNNIDNTSDIHVDGVAPAVPTITLSPSSDSGVSSHDGITCNATPTLNGLAEAGSTVTLYEGAKVIGSTTTDASGSWSFTTSVLSDGVHTFTANAKDAKGNVSAASVTLNITVDTQAPNLSVLPADGATNISINGSIVLTFSEGMDHLTPGMVQLDGTAQAGAWSAGNTVYTVPYSKLVASKSYALTITGFRDIAGNAMAGVSCGFTTGETPIYGGNDDDGKALRTLTDAPTGLSVTGSLPSGATLRINSFTPAQNTTDPALASIRKRMDSTKDRLIFCADITVSGNYSGPLTLAFEVGSQYNGQTVTLLHAKNGTLTTYTAVVKNGIATFTVTSLSPFALFAPALNALGVPNTGDGGTSYGTMAAFGILTLVAGISVVHNQRRYKKEKAN